MDRQQKTVTPQGIFGVQTSMAEDTALLKLSGELDLSTVEKLREHIFRPEVLDAREVRVDLSEITFLDSSGIGVIVTACKLVRIAGGSFSVTCGAKGTVRRVFEIDGLIDYLQVADSPSEAV